MVDLCWQNTTGSYNSMKSWIKKYWTELLVFGVISLVLFIDVSPDMTWINTDSDGVHYIYAAKYFYPSHKGSAPLYLLLGHLFLWIPIATEAWRMALISVISGIAGSVFIYLAILHHTYKNKYSRLFGVAGALIYGSSALAISQNTIVETYPLITALGIMAYYFSIRKWWWACAISLGAGLAIHTNIIFVIIPIIIANKEFRCWEYGGIIAAFLLFYLYIPITNRYPYMWNAPNNTGGLLGFTQDVFATGQMLTGGLSIWDFPKRILDTILQLGLNWNIGIIALGVYVWRIKWYKDLLGWLILLPILYYLGNLAPQTYVYMQPSIAFGAIAIGIGLSKIGIPYNRIWISNKQTKVIMSSVIIVSSLLLIYNANYFDIGRTLDPNLSARQFYNNELSKVPDGQILLAQQGWEWAMVYPYNKNEGRNIIPVNPGSLASKKYQDMLHSWGIKFDEPKEKVTLVELQSFLVKEILNKNKDIWITVPTEPRTYGAKIITYKGNENRLGITPISITDGSKDMQWKWKPSNPYDIITGAIEVEEWIYIIFSNYSVLTFMMMGTIGFIPIWIIGMVVIRKKKWSFKKIREVIA